MTDCRKIPASIPLRREHLLAEVAKQGRRGAEALPVAGADPRPALFIPSGDADGAVALLARVREPLGIDGGKIGRVGLDREGVAGVACRVAPIREAMLALVDDGLMEAVPNKGFRTVPLTEADLAEIYEMRLLLEVPVVARLARGDLPDDRAARLTDLVNTIERTARSRDLVGNLAADRDFHLSLLAAGGNSRLVSTVARLRDQTRLHNLRMINADGGLITSVEEHRPLLAAIMRHDEHTAERLMREHLDHIRQDWSRPAG